jgi:UDP-N-acetyl-2-amino-2-deoxyglucuronate dehydrogenase
MSRMGAAVVGLGVGREHVRAYAQLADTELVAVCDQDADKARRVGEQYGARAYTDVGDVLRDSRVEVVSIATPHLSHAPLAIAAMEAGRHAIVEKPMTLDLREADAMVECSRRTGRTLGVIFQRRFWPASLRARQAIADGKLVTPVSGECELTWWRTERYFKSAPWRGRWDTEGGGVLVNQGIHAMDMFLWFIGDVESVWARWANLSHPYIEVDDNAVAAIQFRSGALGVVRLTTSSRFSRTRVVVHGSNGASVSVNEEPEGSVGYNDVWSIPGEESTAADSLREHLETGEYIYNPLALNPEAVWSNGFEYKKAADPSYHTVQIREFIGAIKEGQEPLVNGESGRKSVELLSAIYESGRTGQPVSFPLHR